MAKTVGTKSKTRTVSLHSRAARRATSPSINLDKSIKAVEPPKANEKTFFSVHDGGIKKRKATKQLSRQQKLKHQRGLERADIVKDQIEVKTKKSIGKSKLIKDRAKEWEDLNAKIEAKAAKNSLAAMADQQPSGNKLAELADAIDVVERGQLTADDFASWTIGSGKAEDEETKPAPAQEEIAVKPAESIAVKEELEDDIL